MYEIEVLYSDLHRKKVSLDQIAELPKDQVLFVQVLRETDNPQHRRVTACWGRDNYAFCHKTDSGHGWVMLFGWDEDDYAWRKLADCEGCPDKEVVDAPLGVMHVIFRGESVSEEVWAEAELIFDEEM